MVVQLTSTPVCQCVCDQSFVISTACYGPVTAVDMTRTAMTTERSIPYS